MQSAGLFLQSYFSFLKFCSSIAALDALASFAEVTHPESAPPGCTYTRPIFIPHTTNTMNSNTNTVVVDDHCGNTTTTDCGVNNHSNDGNHTNTTVVYNDNNNNNVSDYTNTTTDCGVNNHTNTTVVYNDNNNNNNNVSDYTTTTNNNNYIPVSPPLWYYDVWNPQLLASMTKPSIQPNTILLGHYDNSNGSDNNINTNSENHITTTTTTTTTTNPTTTTNNNTNNNNRSGTLVLTGANTGGKTTLLRSICIATIMAHIGCYVPASHAILSPVDRIFTRIGAHDRIAAGESTFHVEMTETAAILRHTQRNSLVLLDELGRGTSTYDGEAIAGSVLQWLTRQIGCRVLFATHYHDLTRDEGIVGCGVQLGYMETFMVDINKSDDYNGMNNNNNNTNTSSIDNYYKSGYGMNDSGSDNNTNASSINYYKSVNNGSSNNSNNTSNIHMKNNNNSNTTFVSSYKYKEGRSVYGSCGVEVAGMVGIPMKVVERANRIRMERMLRYEDDDVRGEERRMEEKKVYHRHYSDNNNNVVEERLSMEVMNVLNRIVMMQNGSGDINNDTTNEQKRTWLMAMQKKVMMILHTEQ